MSSQQPEPRRFTDIEFGYEDVILDGNRFERCQFRHSRLIFHGQALPTFDECVIGDEVDCILGGAALITAHFLTMLYNASSDAGAHAVERFFDRVRRGEFR